MNNTAQPAAGAKSRNHLVWMGVVVALFGLLSYFMVFYRFPALRDLPVLNLGLVLLGFGLSVWGVLRRRSLWSTAGTVLSAACAGLLIWYVFVLSASLPGTETAVAVGQPAPALSLVNHDGTVFTLQDVSDGELLLVFYRGFW